MKRFQQLKRRYLEKYLQCLYFDEMDLTFEQYLLTELEAYEALFHNIKSEEE